MVLGVLWTKKYRVRSVKELAGQDHISKTLCNLLLSSRAGVLPNYIFHGPSGTGKGSMIQAICLDLFGPDLMSERVLEINASDERGIAVMRDRVKYFASLKVGRADPRFPCPPIKVIILDEADSLTHDSQSALRRIIETASGSTRFCLLCNHVSKLLDPISSRCHKQYFASIHVSVIRERLSWIWSQERPTNMSPENRDAQQGLISDIAQYATGDMRKAINVMQACHHDGKLSESRFLEITGMVDKVNLQSLWSKICLNNFKDITEYATIIVDASRSLKAVFGQLLMLVVNADIEDSRQVEACEWLASHNAMLHSCSDEWVLLCDTLLGLGDIIAINPR